MPSTYTIYLKRTFFRLEMLKHTSQYRGGDKEHRSSVLQHLVHLDKTLDAIWSEANQAMEDNLMDFYWRSSVFDRWLNVEFEIQRHSPMDIEIYLEEDEGNRDLLNADPFCKGMPHLLNKLNTF